MLNRLIVAGLALFCAVGAYAQPRSSSQSTNVRNVAASPRPSAAGAQRAAAVSANVVPEVVEGPQATEENNTGMFGGDKPFSLIVDEQNGELEFKFSDTNELEGLIAKTGVILSSEEMTLNADRLDYDTISSKLVASGQRVVVRQGDIIATCQLFKYDPKTQESKLQGQPVVYNKDKNGNVSTTRGKEIDIFSVNGKPQFRVKGGQLNTGGGATAPNPVGGGSSAPAGGLGLNMGGFGGGQSAPAVRPPAPATNRIDPANPSPDLRSSPSTAPAR